MPKKCLPPSGGSVHLGKTWETLFGKRTLTTTMGISELLLSAAPGQTAFLSPSHQIQEGNIMILSILETRKGSGEANQPISGSSRI